MNVKDEEETLKTIERHRVQQRMHEERVCRYDNNDESTKATNAIELGSESSPRRLFSLANLWQTN